jgi:hypothetical protein
MKKIYYIFKFLEANFIYFLKKKRKRKIILYTTNLVEEEEKKMRETETLFTKEKISSFSSQIFLDKFCCAVFYCFL